MSVCPAFFLAYAALLPCLPDTGHPRRDPAGLSTIIPTEDALITDYVLIAGLLELPWSTPPWSPPSAPWILRRSGEPLQRIFPGGGGADVRLFSPVRQRLGLYLAHPAGHLPLCQSRRGARGKYAPVGLLATALSPVVSYIALDNGWEPLW